MQALIQQDQKSFVEMFAAEHYRQVVAGRESERNRIAEAIHAQPLQILCLILNELNSAQHGGETLTEREAFTLEMCREAYHHLSFLEHEERAKDIRYVGLVAFLCDLSGAIEKYHKQPVELVIQPGLGSIRYEIELETALYRIAQNAVYNSIKYAQATAIKITLTEEHNTLHLVVEDNGQGFNSTKANIAKLAAQGHHGLSDMQSYAAAFGGQLTIESRPGRGTSIKASVPTRPYQKPADPHEADVRKILRRVRKQESQVSQKLAKAS